MKACCFIGHRDTKDTPQLREDLKREIINLINIERVHTFYFGSKSSFDNICYCIVSELKQKYNFLKRIYVRAEYENIGLQYKSYLLKLYEETYMPTNVKRAGNASYVKRNIEMINKSDFVLVYYNANKIEKSGTKIAYLYAKKKSKSIINFFSIKLKDS